ncbi:MAG TPA: NUDIX domain-containing protein [Ktedonobacterales bacterium]
MIPTSQPSNHVVGICLVDADGRLLMQLRDGFARVSPNQWGLPGGQVEPGETPEAAARRELLEETGLRVAGALALFWQGVRPSSHRPGAATEWHVYCARTAARQEEVVLGEGAAMLFTPPEAARRLDLSVSAAFFVPLFLDSPAYRELCG